MANYKEHTEKATETSTFRFTLHEKQLLYHLAQTEKKTQTELLRELIRNMAREKGVTSVPASQKRRPGRPRKNEKPTFSTGPGLKENGDTGWNRTTPETRKTGHGEATFEKLTTAIQEAFKGRGEKSRRELVETVNFVTGKDGNRVLMELCTPLGSIDSLRLASLREEIKDSSIRFPLKNLYLTYLRMVFNFGIKEGLVNKKVKTNESIRPLTAKEVADALPLHIRHIQKR